MWLCVTGGSAITEDLIPKGWVLEEALNVDLLPIPRKVSSSKDANTYHCNYGHLTEECQIVNDNIKELIQDGNLCKFVQADGHNTNCSP